MQPRAPEQHRSIFGGRRRSGEKKHAHRAVGTMTPKELKELQAAIDARKASQMKDRTKRPEDGTERQFRE